MDFPAEEEDSEYRDPTRRPTVGELLVAEALIQLHGSSSHSYPLNWRWAAKRKRTGLRSRGGPIAPAAPDEPCPSKPWPDASSPDTPLVVSYSGGSSDPKSGAAAAAAAKTKSVKKRREELRLAESVAQRDRECLRGKIEMVRRKIEWEKSLNIELKRTHKLVIPSQGKDKGQCEKVNTNLTLGLHSSSDAAVLHPHSGVLDASQPLIPNRAAAGADKICSSGPVARALPTGVSLLNLSLGPSPVPDLNLPVEEKGVAGGCNLRPPDHVIVDSRVLSRAAAAMARQRRYKMNKAKLRR